MVRVGDMDSETEHYEGLRVEGLESMEAEATELNRLLPEGKETETVVIMNHSEPGSSSPHSSGSRGSGSRRNTATQAIQMTSLTNGSPQHDEDVDKISSSPDPDPPEDQSGTSRGGEDQTDECSRLTSELEGPPTTGEPHGGEYKKIMELLKEAEASADPEYQERQRNMEYLTKFNPRHSDSGLNFVDYCCNLFQCCAMCIEG